MDQQEYTQRIESIVSELFAIHCEARVRRAEKTPQQSLVWGVLAERAGSLAVDIAGWAQIDEDRLSDLAYAGDETGIGRISDEQE